MMMKWEENVRKVEPYVPGEQPKSSDVIKLNTNECPYPPAPGVRKLAEEFDYGRLRLYPDTEAGKLADALCGYYGITPEQLFIGVGSDDVLALAFLTFFHSGKPVWFPDITYSFYDVWAELFRIPYEVQPLDENFRIRTEDYQKENGGIVFPNPNAPTGVLKPLAEIEEILQWNSDVIVIVDEAYIDFGGESAIPLLEKYDNLLIARTFSKSRSMAGMRIGFLLGSPKLIRYINDCKYSFNSYTMNQAALVSGVEAVRDHTYFHQCTQKIIETREWAKTEFRNLGFEFADSMANFVFVTHPKYPAKELFCSLKEAGIYVRHFTNPDRIQNYLRITIGTKEEMEALFAFLKEYVKG